MIPLTLLFGLYLLPSIIAIVRRHRHVAAIQVINLLLGWLIIPWVICLAWSVSPFAPERQNLTRFTGYDPANRRRPPVIPNNK